MCKASFTNSGRCKDKRLTEAMIDLERAADLLNRHSDDLDAISDIVTGAMCLIEDVASERQVKCGAVER